MMTVIHTSEELDQAIAKSHDHPVVIFKHSATCPYSARAQEEAALAKHDVEIYVHVVQYGKEFSAEIATKTGVEHASPQAIVLNKGKATWSGWRDEIKREVLFEEAALPS